MKVLYGEFDHVPTGIYIPIPDALKWYIIIWNYISDWLTLPIFKTN
jgi:hypothetical protein